MNVIVCIDNRAGMMFNHRRQSMDQVLRDQILARTATGRLFMDAYTAGQFKDELPENAIVCEDFLDRAEEGDFCFVEDKDISPYLSEIDRLIVYRWNRDYPADTYLPVDLTQWNLDTSMDFAGSSHEDITREEYHQ